MNNKIVLVAAVAVYGASVCSAAATLSASDFKICKLQAEKPVKESEAFYFYDSFMYVEFNGLYLPLNHTGHHSEYNQPINDLAYGHAEIEADCAKLRATLVVAEGQHAMAYNLHEMVFYDGRRVRQCHLLPTDLGKQAAKRYGCFNDQDERIAVLVIDRFHIPDLIFSRLGPSRTETVQVQWVEIGSH